MTWPATDVSVVNTDLGSDNPQLSRADILDLMNKFNQLRVAAQLPIGTIYMNGSAATNPATLLGYGTWAPHGAGRVPVGIDPANPLMDTVGETFGSANSINVSHDHVFNGSLTNTSGESANHTHAVSDPGHAHTFTAKRNGSGAETNASAAVTASSIVITESTSAATTGISLGTESVSHSHSVTPAGAVSTTGVTGTNANYQPSIAVYFWMRTA